jgi:hypothetical protein
MLKQVAPTTTSSFWKKPNQKTKAVPAPLTATEEFKFYTITAQVTDPATDETHLENIQGWAYGETGLGYYQHPDNPDTCIPLHLPTGTALGDTFMPLESCQAYLRELSAKLDWHSVGDDGPPDELLPGLVAIKKKHS